MAVAKTGRMIDDVKKMIERAAELQKEVDTLYAQAQRRCRHDVSLTFDGIFTCYICGLRRETKP